MLRITVDPSPTVFLYPSSAPKPDDGDHKVDNRATESAEAHVSDTTAAVADTAGVVSPTKVRSANVATAVDANANAGVAAPANAAANAGVAAPANAAAASVAGADADADADDAPPVPLLPQTDGTAPIHPQPRSFKETAKYDYNYPGDVPASPEVHTVCNKVVEAVVAEAVKLKRKDLLLNKKELDRTVGVGIRDGFGGSLVVDWTLSGLQHDLVSLVPGVIKRLEKWKVPDVGYLHFNFINVDDHAIKALADKVHYRIWLAYNYLDDERKTAYTHPDGTHRHAYGCAGAKLFIHASLKGFKYAAMWERRITNSGLLESCQLCADVESLLRAV